MRNIFNKMNTRTFQNVPKCHVVHNLTFNTFMNNKFIDTLYNQIFNVRDANIEWILLIKAYAKLNSVAKFIVWLYWNVTFRCKIQTNQHTSIHMCLFLGYICFFLSSFDTISQSTLHKFNPIYIHINIFIFFQKGLV